MANRNLSRQNMLLFSSLTDKYAFKFSLFAVIFTCILSLSAVVSETTTPRAITEVESDFIVQDLRVEDVPNDDGSGLIVSWKPLGIDKRIIEYRIYRGASPDSLYFVGSVPVNPQTGFAGERVFFYDSGYTIFFSINSPGSLRQEAQQPANSPLFREIPRDLSITGPKLKNYNILGVIPTKQFYYRTEKVVLEEDGEENPYAGLHLRQFEYLLKKLIPDNPYYYTVVAVNERRRYFPHAPIESGTPRINVPEKPRELNAVYIEDDPRLQFEWSLPLISDALQNVNIYLLHQNDLEAFNLFYEEQIVLEENRLQRFKSPDLQAQEQTRSMPGNKIFSRSYNSMTTAIVEFDEGVLRNPETNAVVDITPENVNQYYALFSLKSFYGMESYSAPVRIKNLNSETLPQVPSFTVMDKPNDQGDYLTIYWGEPVVFLTNSSFINRSRPRLTINYEYETNDNYKIDNIYFDVYDDNDELITSVNEFYQNLRFNITLPEKYSPESSEFDPERRFRFRMRFQTSGRELPDDYVLVQDMYWNEDYRAFSPNALFAETDELSRLQDYNYLLYKKPYTGETFRLASRSAGVVRVTDDNIRYETEIYKVVSKSILERGLLLVDPYINAFYDKENRTTVNTPIYLSMVRQNIDNYRLEIADLTSQLDLAETEEQRVQYQNQIDYYQRMLAQNDSDFMTEANSRANDRSRMRFISERRERELRTFQYKIVKTDNEGGFVISEPFVDEEGNPYVFPIPNWFNYDRFPTLIASLVFALLVFHMIRRAKKGQDIYIRPIAGLQEIDNAIGRATEMGRPILFNPGLSGINDVATLAGLSILGRVATKAAEYDTRILVPVRDYIVMPIAQEMVKEAHYEAGRPDTYDKSSVFFITTDQFAFVAGVNGVMVREKCATCFYMGMYWAEALIMTETGNTIGAVQIAGSDSATQLPFFITTCDYTLIGEELYGASAYLSREPLMMGSLKAVDVFKFLILVFVILGTALSTAQLTFLINIFPDK